MAKRGIDVSYAQGDIDWKAVKKSGKVDFVILRAGYGREASQCDEMFERNYKGCKAVGLPVGVYWYSYAVDEDDAVREANACLWNISGKQFEYPVYFDIEESSQFDKGKAFVSKIAKAFIKTIRKGGYYGGLYTNANWIRNVIDSDLQNNYTIWLAAHTGDKSVKPDYNGQYGMWQYSSSGFVEGIGTRVDCNECYSDYPAKIKSMGLNGYKKTVVKGDANKDGVVNVRDAAKIAHDLASGKKPPDNADYNGDGKSNIRDAAKIAHDLAGNSGKKSVDEVAREVIAGDWGNGAERKERLTDAGYNYEAVQKEVNRLLG